MIFRKRKRLPVRADDRRLRCLQRVQRRHSKEPCQRLARLYRIVESRTGQELGRLPLCGLHARRIGAREYIRLELIDRRRKPAKRCRRPRDWVPAEASRISQLDISGACALGYFS